MRDKGGRVEEVVDEAIPNDRSHADPTVEMTRGQQTAWIVGTLIVISLAFAYWATRLPESDPFAKCQRIIGHDNACRAQVAASQMMKGYY